MYGSSGAKAEGSSGAMASLTTEHNFGAVPPLSKALGLGFWLSLGGAQPVSFALHGQPFFGTIFPAPDELSLDCEILRANVQVIIPRIFFLVQ